MPTRLPYYNLFPKGFQALMAIEEALHATTLPRNLFHLIKLRVSQINGCAYCIDMHWKDLRALGEPENRLYALDAWHEFSLYSEQERAALEWAEALTHISKTHAEDELYERVKKHFTDQQLVELTFAITNINAWNRLAISMRSEPGHYKSKLTPT